MYEYKLQIGCLLVVAYFVIAYIRETSGGKCECNKYFDALLIVAPWAIVFDGVTAWTVNHQDVVPAWANLLLHCLFLLLENALIIAVFVYTVDQTIGIRKRFSPYLLALPGMVAQVLIVAHIGELEYIPGETTYYSMGTSPIICYLSLILHFFATIMILNVYHRTVEKKKLYSILFFYALVLLVLLVQVVLPESLVSSLFPTLAVMGIYISFEDPALLHLQEHNQEMVAGFATLVESRDNSTGGHIKRTRGYVKILLGELQHHPYYRNMLTEDYVQNVKKAAPMHDIGKIATPDRILQKPGKLTDEEFEIMKKHAADGGEIIKQTFCVADSPDYERIAYEVARYHHEKWNGKGYPEGLQGEDIPLHARIMAIADVFDAVSAKRCYRDALPIDTCVKIIEEGAGRDFDPKLVEVFMAAKDKILAYYEAEKDPV